MRIQFQTSTMLLATAFVGICAGGIIPYVKRLQAEPPPRPLGEVVQLVALSAFAQMPMLIPCAFLVYALGRRKLTAGMIAWFAAAEALAVAAFLWAVG